MPEGALSRRQIVGIIGAGTAGLALPLATGNSASADAPATVPLRERPVRAPAGRSPSAKPITASAFRTPAAHYRPGVRWWWAAPLGIDETVREITAISEAGFGEVEIAFSADSWANDDQRANLRAVLDKAAESGTKVSMTMGASWPVQTPNTGTGSGFSQGELQYGRTDVAGGSTFSGALPFPFDDATGKRPSTVVAVIAAKVTTRGPAPTRSGATILPPATSTVLDEASLTDLTSTVSEGKLTWTAPSGDWIVLTFWQRDAAKVVTSVFDKAAAAKAAEYLDANQVGPANADALKLVGGNMFEDSLELNADSLFWAPNFLTEFKARRGYDMTRYLPFMYQHGMSRYWVPNTPPTADFDLPDGKGDKIRNDYYTLLTDLYVDDHLLPFQRWAETYGMVYKAQAAYGQDIEPIRSFRELARMGGRCEGESYNSGDRFPTNIDNYGWRFALDWQRSVVGGSHQGGVTRVSTELGPQTELSGQINIGDYKAMIDKEWAAGLTQPFLHGYQYMSLGAPWPGKYRFGDNVLDSFNDVNKPQWPVFKDATAYWARGTQVLETGVPLTDIAIYRKGFLTTAARNQDNEGTQPAQLFETRRLERRGYSVQYLDPEGLAEPGTVGKGVLFPDGPQYRALVIDERSLSVPAAQAVAKAAASGLTIVFVGDLPDKDITFGSGTAGDAQVAKLVKQALKGKHVRRCATQNDVAASLDAEDLAPRAAWENAEVFTQMRQADKVLYLFLYNPGNSDVTFSPAIEGSGAVLDLDLWTGAITPVARYASGAGRVTVPMTLKAQQTRVIALDSSVKEKVHVVGDGPDGGTLVTTADGRISWKTTEGGSQRLRLSNGGKVTVSAEIPDHLALQGPHTWGLSVEAYTPTGHRTINIGGLYGTFPLWDWRDRTEIAGESGIGTYTGTLTVPDNWLGEGSGVQINLGEVDGTAEVYIGDQKVGTQVTSDVTWDLTPFVKAGDNALKVVVRTTIRNAVTHYNRTSSRTSSYGLLGPLRVQPFATATVYAP